MLAAAVDGQAAMQRWSQRHEFLIHQATLDLETSGGVRPFLVAFRGEDPLVVAGLRPFGPGAYEAPMTEVLALALALRADRLALSMGGRAWSLADPTPPVLPGGPDLRQQVVVVEEADGHGAAPRCESVLYPYGMDGGEVTWAAPFHAGRAEGWVPGALRVVATADCPPHPAAPREIRAQAVRCVALGHLVALAPQVAARVDGLRLPGR